MTIIFQGFNKYELSLRKNVAFSDINELDNLERIEEAIREVVLSHLITELDDGIDHRWGTGLEADNYQKDNGKGLLFQGFCLEMQM